jgi:hypothetical protein
MNTLPPELIARITNRLEWDAVIRLCFIGDRQLLRMLTNGGIEHAQLSARVSDIYLPCPSVQSWNITHLQHLEVDGENPPTRMLHLQPETLASSLTSLVLKSPILFHSLRALIFKIDQYQVYMLRFPCPNLKSLCLKGDGPAEELLIDFPAGLTSLTFHHAHASYKTPQLLKNLPSLLTTCHINVLLIIDREKEPFKFHPLITNLSLSLVRTRFDYLLRLPVELLKLELGIERSIGTNWKWENLPRKLTSLDFPIVGSNQRGGSRFGTPHPISIFDVARNLPPTIKHFKLGRKVPFLKVSTMENAMTILPQGLENCDGIYPDHFLPCLPSSLISLSKSIDTRPNFDPMILPPNLEELVLGGNADVNLVQGCRFPSRLTKLNIDGVRQDILEALPMTLTELKVQYAQLDPSQAAILPQTLKILTIPFQTDKVHANLPMGLTQLNLSHLVNLNYSMEWLSYLLHMKQSLTELNIGTLQVAPSFSLSQSWGPISQFSKLVTLSIAERDLESDWIHLIPRTVTILSLRELARGLSISELCMLPPNLTDLDIVIGEKSQMQWKGPEFAYFPKTIRKLSIHRIGFLWEPSVVEHLPSAIIYLSINQLSRTVPIV